MTSILDGRAGGRGQLRLAAALLGAAALWPGAAAAEPVSFIESFVWTADNSGLGYSGTASTGRDFSRSGGSSARFGAYQSFKTPKSCIKIPLIGRICTPSINLGTYGSSLDISGSGGIRLDSSVGAEFSPISFSLPVDTEVVMREGKEPNQFRLDFNIAGDKSTAVQEATNVNARVNAGLDFDAFVKAEVQAGGGRSTVINNGFGAHTPLFEVFDLTIRNGGSIDISTAGQKLTYEKPFATSGLQPVPLPIPGGLPGVNEPVKAAAAFEVPLITGRQDVIGEGINTQTLRAGFDATSPLFQLTGSLTNFLSSIANTLKVPIVTEVSVGGSGVFADLAIDQFQFDLTASLRQLVQYEGIPAVRVFFDKPVNVYELERFDRLGVYSVDLRAGSGSQVFEWADEPGSIIGRTYSLNGAVYQTTQAVFDLGFSINDIVGNYSLGSFTIPIINQTFGGFGGSFCLGCTTFPISQSTARIYKGSAGVRNESVSFGVIDFVPPVGGGGGETPVPAPGALGLPALGLIGLGLRGVGRR